MALAYEALKAGGSVPTVYNAANEKAVELFLARKISYLQIPELIRKSMEVHDKIMNPDVNQILALEESVYDRILGWIS